MMVHEQPIPIHQKKSNHANNSTKTKQKPSSSVSSTAKSQTEKLSKAKSKKAVLRSPSLPNGSKPNFGNSEPAPKPKVHKKSCSNEPSLPNGTKPNFGGAKKVSNPSTKKSQDSYLNQNIYASSNLQTNSSPSLSVPSKNQIETTYAGSSFHSSPSVLNLPKPSLIKSATSPIIHPRKSPSSNPHPHSQFSTSTPDSAGSSKGQMVSPHSPQHPVTAYTSGIPMNNHPAMPPVCYNVTGVNYLTPNFNYNVTPTGYINYLPQNQYYQPQHPMHPQLAPQMQQPPVQFQSNYDTQGTKISFNDLLDSNSQSKQSNKEENEILENDLKKMLKLA